MILVLLLRCAGGGRDEEDHDLGDSRFLPMGKSVTLTLPAGWALGTSMYRCLLNDRRHPLEPDATAEHAIACENDTNGSGLTNLPSILADL